jgi:uncharacterized protein (TIGR03435 family)
MKRATINASLMVLASLALFAQQFEVASVKPSDPAGRGPMMTGDPGRVNLRGMTLNLLIQQAFGVRSFQISAGPGWINSDRYDIVAKVPDNDVDQTLPVDLSKLTDEQRKTWQRRRQAMMQALLADRFQLKIHRETKELPIYVLTAAKGGSKLKDNGDRVDADVRPGMIRMGRGLLSATQIPVSDFILALSQVMGRTIVDRTGLNGRFNIDLKWTPDQGSDGVLGGGPPPPGAAGPPPDTDGPTIFTAIQEQLGLKLDSGKGPVEVIVIDHAGKPTEN